MSNHKVIPMLFNTEMVSALLQGRKTQTRRPVKMPDGWDYKDLDTITSKHPKKGRFGMLIQRDKEFVETDLIPAPCAQGDLIYVRETFADIGCRLTYKADDDDGAHCVVKRWTPSIHMPRSASRITLKVTDVRAEVITDISREDALAEGIERWDNTYSCTPYRNYLKAPNTLHFSTPELSFLSLWDATYQTNSLKEKPLVCVIKFEVIKQNIDSYLEEIKTGSKL